MSVRTDVINLSVNINGNVAQNNLNELRKKAADLTYELKNGLKKGTQEFIDKAAELKKVKAEMDDLKKQIGITSLSLKDLNQEAIKFKSLRDSVTHGTADWKKYNAELQAVVARQKEVSGGVKGVQSTFSSLGSLIKGIGLLGAGYLGSQFLTSVITNTAKYTDSLADMQRVTGLTAAEAKGLNDELKALDTRTSTVGLQNIVIIAGKLGVAKNQLLDFTKAVDKLVVALGDELGDASQITTQLGKILNVFEGEITGDNITKLGNAIVDLANKGVASGGFMVDFAQRLSGLAGTANLTLDATLGLAAGLEETGQRTESSSTAVINVLGLMGNHVKEFAKAAGKDLGEFEKTVREKPVEALLQLSEGIVKNKNGLQELAPAFKEFGIDGTRVQTVLGIMGAKANFFREKITETGVALQNTSAITGAFELKNQTFGAELDKLTNKWENMKVAIGEKLIPVFNIFLDRATQAGNAISGLFSADKWKDDLDDFWQALKTLDKSEIWRSFSKGATKRESTPYIESKLPLLHPDQPGQFQRFPVAPIFLGGSAKGTTPEKKPAAAATDKAAESKAEALRKKLQQERDASLKRAEEYYKKELELITKSNRKESEDLKAKYKEQAEDQDSSLAQRIAAIELYRAAGNKLIAQTITDEQAVINAERKTALEGAKTDKERQAIKSFYKQKEVESDKRNALEATKFQIEVSNQFTKAVEDDFKKISAAGDKAYEDIRKKAEASFKAQLTIIALDTNNKLIKLDEDFQNGKITNVKKYQKQREQIIQDGNRKELQFQLDTITRFRDILKAAGITNAEIEQKIAGLKVDINKAKNDKKVRDKEERLELIQKTQETANQVIDIAAQIAEALNNKEQAQFNKEKKNNDAKAAGYKKQLDGKLLSQAQYDKKIAALNEEQDRKKHELDVKAFKRQKALQLANTIINTAAGVAASFPDLIKMVFIAAVGLAQILKITSQKPPEAAKGDWFRNGPSHSQGGIPVIIEGDEAVITKKAMNDKDVVTVTGTTAQITSALNKRGGGVNWAGGATVVDMPAWRTQRPASINPNMSRIMEQGGVVRKLPGSSAGDGNEQTELLKRNNQLLEQQINEMKNWKTKIKGEWVIKDLDATRAKYDQAKNVSGL